MTNSNGAIVAQLKSKQSQSETAKIQTEKSDITDDARMTARQDAIEWGKAYKKYLEDYKEEARMIINERILSGSGKAKSLDLDESMFFAPADTFFMSNSDQDTGDK